MVNWTLRNLLYPINGGGEAEMSPMLGTNLYLTHLFPLSVNPRIIQAVHTGTTMTEIKYYSCKNRVLNIGGRGLFWAQLGSLPCMCVFHYQ